MIIWFNIAYQNRQYSIWQTCIINSDFDKNSFKYESCEWDENDNPHTIYVTKEHLNHTLPREVTHAFEDMDLLISKVKEAYELREDVPLGNTIIHIYNVFDMSNTNEYGIGKALWD